MKSSLALFLFVLLNFEALSFGKTFSENTTFSILVISDPSAETLGYETLDVLKLGDSAFLSDGSLSEDGVVRLLKSEGLISDSFFEPDGRRLKNEAVFVVESILKVDGVGSRYGKIYRIFFNKFYLGEEGSPNQVLRQDGFKQRLIIKYIDSADLQEIKNINAVRNSGLAHLPMNDLGFPIISLHEKAYFYQNQGDHSLVVLHSAQGKMVEEYFKDILIWHEANEFEGQGAAKDSAERALEIGRRAFFKAGLAIGKIHLRFLDPTHSDFLTMKTVVHGDYHAGNIFYCESTDRIYLIDNETMAESLQESQYFGIDIQVFIENLSDLETPENKSLVLGLYSDFVAGYLSSFPEDLRSQMLPEVEKIVEASRRNK